MNKKLMILIIAFVLLLAGATYAYWSWTTTSAQQTAVTFTVDSGFTCSADGGGNITSASIQLIPASCTNSTYAIKRTITVSPTITANNTEVYMDLWLKVNEIGLPLASTPNFKYALTTSASNCTTGVVTQGMFFMAVDDTEIYLLHDKMYSSSTTETYYLWIWLDAAETNNNTQNQTFDIELGGNCTTQEPKYVYMANVLESNDDYLSIGDSVPDDTYDTPEDAIEALETAYSNKFNGATANLPIFIRNKIGDGTVWCATYDSTAMQHCSFKSQTQCLTFGNNPSDCVEKAFTNGIIESQVGFMITPEMAANNSGYTAGTYYLSDPLANGSYDDNVTTVKRALGSANCLETGSNSYMSYCGTSELVAYVSVETTMAFVGNMNNGCFVQFGLSGCALAQIN